MAPPATYRSPELAHVSELIDKMTFDVRREPSRVVADPPRPAHPFQHLLAGTDGTPASEPALAWTAHIAKLDAAKVDLVTVASERMYVAGFEAGAAATGFLEAEETRAREALTEARKAMANYGVKAETLLGRGSAAATISHEAETRGADLIVVGAHGGGRVKHALLGSVSDGVKNHAFCNVLIAKTTPPVRGILCPVDGSPASKDAAAIGIRLGRAWNAPVRILHVVPPPAFGPPSIGEALFEAAFDRLGMSHWREPGVVFDLQYGKPAPAIIEAARGHEDLIVMGAGGLGGWSGLVPGSVSNRVAHEAESSVLLVKPRNG